MIIWQPINLTEQCPPDAQFNACSSFAYFYLHVLTQLYGGSEDIRKQKRLERERIEERYGHEWVEESIHKFDRTDDNYERKYDGKNSYDDEERKDKEYDFIVVGAGAAGCVVASRLTEHNVTVLLLEAGPEQPDVTRVPAFAASLMGSNIMWMYRTKPDGKSCLAHQDQRCSWPLGKTMGGGSSVNSLSYIRGNKLDYDTWADMGNVGWSYDDVLPFFKKSEKNLDIEILSEKYHSDDGLLPISFYPFIDEPSIMMTKAYNERGLPIKDYNGKSQVGTMQAQAFSQHGQRMSTNNAFIQNIRYKRKNLTVRVESLAVEVLIDHGKAYGVKYIKNGKLCVAKARKEVIVSAGPINGAKLLMLSGVGPKKHLEEAGIEVKKDLPVGYNLHDHVTLNGILIVLPNGTATSVSNQEVIEAITEFKQMENKKGPLSGNGAVNSISFYKTSPALAAPDIQYQADVVQDWPDYINAPSIYKSIPIFPTAYYDGILPRAMLVAPLSRGRLYLNMTDPYGEPIIDPNYFGRKEDMHALIKGVQFLLTLEETEAFKKHGAYFYKESLQPCENLKWGTDSYIDCMARSYTSTPYHPVGTSKMGPEWDKMAVVDPTLRVYGVKSLRVIDSSIMPVVPRGNTNAPSIMVGEKGAHMVLKYYGLV